MFESHRWIKDLTKDGVIADDVGTWYPVCCFDELNLCLSGKAVLNSCSESLHKAVERVIPTEAQRVGPLVYFQVINWVQPLCCSYTKTLQTKLEAMLISKIPGENMTQYQADTMAIIDEIYMSVLDKSDVPPS